MASLALLPSPAPGDDAADSRLRRIMGDDGMERLVNATVMVLGFGRRGLELR